MSWDYLNDFFGKFRKKKTRFTDVEVKAKNLLKSFLKGELSDKEFANAFEDVRSRFVELTTVNGHTTIDQDTPLWLNTLLGIHYVKWLNYQQIKWYFEEHPEELTGENQYEFRRIQDMGYDEMFKDACITVLKETS